MWKIFSLLYSPNTVNPLCHNAAYDSCGSSSCVPHTDQHPPCKPTNRAQCWLSCRPCYKKMVFLPTKPTIRGGFPSSLRLTLLLSAPLFQVRRHSVTLQCRAELRFDHQAVVDWSQFCHKAISNFILVCSSQRFLMAVGGEGGGWHSCGNT